MTKRSISIAGHRTSLSIEQEFWKGLGEIADTGGCSITSIVVDIDNARLPGTNLSSAVRVYVLDWYRRKPVG